MQKWSKRKKKRTNVKVEVEVVVVGVQPGGRWRLMRDCSLGMRFHKKL